MAWKCDASIDSTGSTERTITSKEVTHTRRRLNAGRIVQIERDHQVLRAAPSLVGHARIAQVENLCPALVQPAIPPSEADQGLV